ncbi:MAG TPA: adenosylmethionine--8-amino-7-oxononanoate transaminase [Pedomonas sp.]|uniref:adenosylmethionine--8-amino-7-oxononanoate transaminase n=1 Tax=Pedomonas sp. TaxID=2976421 RepID=UPI002F417D62
MTGSPTRNPAGMPEGMPDWMDEGLAHLWLPYTQMKTAPAPLPVASTEGVRIRLTDGSELVDGIASWWTAAHGYRHPHIEAAVKRQLETLPHVMLGGLMHEQAATLAARLARMLPGDLDRVFFCESGSVSVEIAMKMAVQYWLNKGERRTRFLSFTGGYHGDTFVTMSVCDPEEGMHTMFRGVVPEQLIADLPVDDDSTARFEALLAAKGHEIAAVLVEPLVQGAGGMRFHDAATLQRLRAACDRHGILLVFDEIFVGFARTGLAMFACEATGVLPDILTLSKALTGGTLPLAATVASKKVFDAFWDDDPLKALMHGPTYMGNALACAAANASLDLFEQEARLGQAQAIGRHLAAGLEPARGLPGVRDVRVLGGIGVIELSHLGDAAWLKQRFREEGVWLRPFGNILYTTPALTIGEDDLNRLTTALVKVAGDWSARFGTHGPLEKGE